MEPKTKELIDVLASIIELLEEDDETHWLTWMKKSKALVVSSNFYGIEKLLGAYGGMGSFNDLVICQGSDSKGFFWKKSYIKKNEALSTLRSKAFELANAIKKEQLK